MISAIQSALQGLQRSEKGFQVAANNIANLNTNGYRSQRYDAGADTVEIRDPLANLDSDPRGEDIPVNDVNLAGEIVNQIANKTAFKANAATIRIANETTGTLLDILAK